MQLHNRDRTILWSVITVSLVTSILSAIAVDIWLNQRISIIGNFVGLQRSFNTGVAFGIDLGIAEPILIAFALFAVCWMALAKEQTKLLDSAFGLILGGGFANVLDRLRDGAVTDMFQVGSFPIFNVADSCITVGVVLLLSDSFWQKR